MGVVTEMKRIGGRATLGVALAGSLATTAAAAPPSVPFGTAFTLSGAVPSKAAGEPVRVFSRSFGQEKFGRIATVTTIAGGHWSYKARPRIRTTYLAAWRGRTTSTVDVRVSPFLDLDLANGVLSVRGRTIRSLAGRFVIVQLRRPGGLWRNVRKVVLDGGSDASTRFSAPLGRSDMRLYMPQSQVGAGYVAGYSPILVFRKTA
jgi:hypothetical protein